MILCQILDPTMVNFRPHLWLQGLIVKLKRKRNEEKLSVGGAITADGSSNNDTDVISRAFGAVILAVVIAAVTQTLIWQCVLPLWQQYQNLLRFEVENRTVVGEDDGIHKATGGDVKEDVQSEEVPVDDVSADYEIEIDSKDEDDLGVDSGDDDVAHEAAAADDNDADSIDNSSSGSSSIRHEELHELLADVRAAEKRRMDIDNEANVVPKDIWNSSLKEIVGGGENEDVVHSGEENTTTATTTTATTTTATAAHTPASARVMERYRAAATKALQPPSPQEQVVPRVTEFSTEIMTHLKRGLKQVGLTDSWSDGDDGEDGGKDDQAARNVASSTPSQPTPQPTSSAKTSMTTKTLTDMERARLFAASVLEESEAREQRDRSTSIGFWSKAMERWRYGNAKV